MPDSRLIADTKLEWEADRSGVIHLRRHPGETQFLEGYGTTNFGMLLSAGIATAGVLGWKYTSLMLNLALLISESVKS